MYYNSPVTDSSPALHCTSPSVSYNTRSISSDSKSGLKITTMTAPPTPDECLEMHHGPLDVWTPHDSPTFPCSAQLASTSSSVGTMSPVAYSANGGPPGGGVVGNAEVLHQHLTRLYQQRNEDHGSNAKGKARAFNPSTYASPPPPGARWN